MVDQNDRLLDSNLGLLVLGASAVSAVPQPLPIVA